MSKTFMEIDGQFVPVPKTRVVTTAVSVLEMWSETDEVWVAQKHAVSQTIVDMGAGDE